MNESFKYNEDAKYRTGGVYEPTHQLSLVHQVITIKRGKSFDVRFPNIWLSYKLPLVKEAAIYDNWVANQMQFWQNQLNFAIWCATSGCGVSKLDHLKHKDPMIRSVFRFHAYYQIRRILSEMKCPLPTDQSWNPLNNGIDTSAFERICAEFEIPSKADFRQRLDNSHGMGSFYFYKKFYQYKFIVSKKWTELTNGGDYDPSMNWKISIHADRFKGADEQTDKIEYIKQTFSKQLSTDPSTEGNQFDAIGSFVPDKSSGFTQSGVSRINDSIRAYVWAVVGAQTQARSSILGAGKAFDAQKQFLANVEDVINSEVDLPSSIERYQLVLQYARSKVDFVVGLGLYMMPSDMDLYVGTINGYNNLITIATDDLKLGHNDTINEEQQIQQNQFDSPPDDFELVPDDPPLQPINEPMNKALQEEPINEDTAINKEAMQLQKEAVQDESMQVQQKAMNKEVQQKAINKTNEELTHEENKLLLTLLGITLGSVIMWTLR